MTAARARATNVPTAAPLNAEFRDSEVAEDEAVVWKNAKYIYSEGDVKSGPSPNFTSARRMPVMS